MKLYKMILLLFTASLFMAALNTSGIFDSALPTQKLAVSSANITELTESDDAETGIGAVDGILGGVNFLSKSVGILFSIVFSVFTIDSLLRSLGVPEPLVIALYSMVILISLFGLMKYISGRSDKGME